MRPIVVFLRENIYANNKKKQQCEEQKWIIFSVNAYIHTHNHNVI